MIAKAITCLDNNGTKPCFDRRSYQLPRQVIDLAVQLQLIGGFLSFFFTDAKCIFLDTMTGKLTNKIQMIKNPLAKNDLFI
jgi:hypothetical protein